MSTAAELKRLYNKGKKRKILVLLSLFIALLVSIVVSISLGAASPGFSEALSSYHSLSFSPSSILILDPK